MSNNDFGTALYGFLSLLSTLSESLSCLSRYRRHRSPCPKNSSCRTTFPSANRIIQVPPIAHEDAMAKYHAITVGFQSAPWLSDPLCISSTSFSCSIRSIPPTTRPDRGPSFIRTAYSQSSIDAPAEWPCSLLRYANAWVRAADHAVSLDICQCSIQERERYQVDRVCNEPVTNAPFCLYEHSPIDVAPHCMADNKVLQPENILPGRQVSDDANAVESNN